MRKKSKKRNKRATKRAVAVSDYVAKIPIIRFKMPSQIIGLSDSLKEIYAICH